jgi:resuscitation-promoting factor RpfB
VPLVRRILLLVAVSVTGVALLAPLAARSATPVPVALDDDRLVAAEDQPVTSADRGSLSGRGDAAGSSPASEAIGGGALRTPPVAPMEATLLNAAPAAERVVTYDGDTMWDALAMCESGGNWAINTGNGYYGGLQFSYDSWHGNRGGAFAEYPHLATREEQIVVGERLHAIRGFAPWPSCRAKLGLP